MYTARIESSAALNPRSRRIVSSTPRNRSISVRFVSTHARNPTSSRTKSSSAHNVTGDAYDYYQRSQSEQSLGLRAALPTIRASYLRLRAVALAILELSPIASDTAHSLPTTSRIASGSPRNRCDHCLDCEETLPARSLTSARGWSDWECPLCGC